MNRYLNQPTAHSQHMAVSVTWSISPPQSQSDSTGTHTHTHSQHAARLGKARACSACMEGVACVTGLGLEMCVCSNAWSEREGSTSEAVMV